MEANEIPKWVETLSWVFVAGALALAIIGPRLFGPIIEKWRASLPNPPTPTIGPQLAVVGAAFADRDVLQQLTEAINRLCDIMDERMAAEESLHQETKTRNMIRELMKQMTEQEDREVDRRK